MDENDWDRLTDLFDRLLAGEDPALLESQTDPALRSALRDLWSHHLQASENDFLAAGVSFEILPVFSPGQLLANRFRIRKLLGRGGMGEVYLAHDSRIDEPVAIKTVARLLAPSHAGPQADRRRSPECAPRHSSQRVPHP